MIIFLLVGKLCPPLTSKVMVISRTPALQLPAIYWCGQFSRNLPKCLAGHSDTHIPSSSWAPCGETSRLRWCETERWFIFRQTNRQNAMSKNNTVQFCQLYFVRVDLLSLKLSLSLPAPSSFCISVSLARSTRWPCGRAGGSLVGICRLCVCVRSRAYLHVWAVGFMPYWTATMCVCVCVSAVYFHVISVRLCVWTP